MHNRWLNAAIPGIALHACIGSVYCFSQYSRQLMEVFGASKFSIDIGFTLIIFFLGMMAALFGKTVEQSPKKGAFLSTCFFTIGMIVVGMSVEYNIWSLYYIGCCLIGTGTGIGYISPVKTLMTYFKDHKGLASGLAITGFGLAKFIASPAIEWLLENCSLCNMFYVMSLVYLVIMSISTVLLQKHPDFVDMKYTETTPFSYYWKNVYNTAQYRSIWLMFCINISCGLAFIANEKGILNNIGIMDVAIILSLCALFNALGRLGFSALSDKIGRKKTELLIVLFAIIAIILCLMQFPWTIVLGILMIESNYGGAFATKPSLLSMKYGLQNASTTHSFLLIAWSFGGIFGPLMANLMNFNTLLYMICILYIVEIILLFNIKKD